MTRSGCGPAGGTYRACTPETPPPRNALLQERCTRSPALRPRGIVSPRRPLDFGCGRIGPSTLQSTYPQGIIPRKDDPPRFGCSPPTAGGTARTPAKCTPPHRLRTATDPATKAKNTGTTRTHPKPSAIASSRRPTACRTRSGGRLWRPPTSLFRMESRGASLPRRNTRRSAAVSGAPLPHF